MSLETNKRIEQVAIIAAITLLVLGCLLVLRPFISSILWASILTFSTWPAYERLRKFVKNRNNLAAFIMTLGVSMLFLLPVIVVGITMADNAGKIVGLIKGVFESGFLNQPPEWLTGLPVIGGQIAEYWSSIQVDQQAALDGIHSLLNYIKKILISMGGNIGSGLFQMTLSVLIAFFLYRDGIKVAETLREAMHKITGERTQELIHEVGSTVFAVVYGIVGTAVAQGIMAGIGFLIAGIPGAFLLAFLTFLLSFLPAGAVFVWLPVTIWLFSSGYTGWGIFMGLWGFLGISGVDNIIRPYIISKGTKLPFVLVLLGVLGGVLAFGFLGLFLGPVLLTVGYTLLSAWNKKAEKI